jgi:hypothetical protein
LIRVRSDSLLALPYVEYMEEDGQCMGVDIYSFKIAAWIFKESKWSEKAHQLTFSRIGIVFLNGCLHYIGCDGYCHILAVDMEENS